MTWATSFTSPDVKVVVDLIGIGWYWRASSVVVIPPSVAIDEIYVRPFIHFPVGYKLNDNAWLQSCRRSAMQFPVLVRSFHASRSWRRECSRKPLRQKSNFVADKENWGSHSKIGSRHEYCFSLWSPVIVVPLNKFAANSRQQNVNPVDVTGLKQQPSYTKANRLPQTHVSISRSCLSSDPNPHFHHADDHCFYTRSYFRW